MKILFRNFVYLLKKYKLILFLNLVGLAVSFALFIVIMMQIRYHVRFNHSIENVNQIYRLETNIRQEWSTVMCRPVAEIFANSSTAIARSAIAYPWANQTVVSGENDDFRQSFKEIVMSVSMDYPELFRFNMREGNRNGLDAPNSVIIPAGIAIKLYGNSYALGKRIKINDNIYSVGGVYNEFPSNTSIPNFIFAAIPVDESKTDWGNWSYISYIEIEPGADPDKLIENFVSQHDVNTFFGSEFIPPDDFNLSFRLTAFKNLHYVNDVKYDLTPKGNRNLLFTFLTIGFVILIIAGINFINADIAMTSMRIKSINTQKILGAQSSDIRRYLIFETIVICILAYLLAVVIIWLFKFVPVSQMVDVEIKFSGHFGLLATLFGFVLLYGFLLSLYPAYRLTSVPLNELLKTNYNQSRKGRMLRTSLITFQFIASFVLIIMALFMSMQNYYMQNTNLGYAYKNIIAVEVNPQVNQNITGFTNDLTSFPWIEGVAYSEVIMGAGEHYSRFYKDYNGSQISFESITVSPEFIEVMEIELLEGRTFRREDQAKESQTLIFNQKARQDYDLVLNTTVEGNPIIGFIDNIKFASLRTSTSPLVLVVDNHSLPFYNVAFVKFQKNTSLKTVISDIERTLNVYDDVYPFEINYYPEILKRIYENEKNQNRFISVLSGIAVLISLCGIFSLLVFENQSRRKEIGVRKILGSTSFQIVTWLNKPFVNVVFYSFLIASPLAWYMVHRWLENFAYKIEIFWWIFLLVFMLIFFLTIVISSWHNWKAANVNPVEIIQKD